MSKKTENPVSEPPALDHNIPDTGLPDLPQNANRLWRSFAVLLGMVFMAWPALFNRYPLLYPDSVTYLQNGRPVARALFLHKFSEYYGMRSFIYGLGILPWHWNITPWPIVALQAFLAAYVLWLVVRSILPRRTVTWYLILVALLSLVTSLSWFVSLIMPDILGPLLYLCIFLLVFARESLSRMERVAVALIAWWAITSHATHFALAAGICFLLTLLLLLRRPLMHRRLFGLAQVALVLLLAAAAQLALHAYLYGEPSLNGERPPFLASRVMADGPGRWYLEQHCPQANLALCAYVGHLPDDSDVFLWGPDSVFENADEETQTRINQEETRFVLATLRAYPRAQLSKSVVNFWQQLTTFEVWNFDPNAWMSEALNHTLTGGRASFLRSRQARDAMPSEFFADLQFWTVIVSLVLIAAFLPFLWRRRDPRLTGLFVIIVSAVIANAFVTGALSTVEERYQCRVVWLLPLLAALLVLRWSARWHKMPRPAQA